MCFFSQPTFLLWPTKGTICFDSLGYLQHNIEMLQIFGYSFDSPHAHPSSSLVFFILKENNYHLLVEKS